MDLHHQFLQQAVEYFEDGFSTIRSDEATDQLNTILLEKEENIPIKQSQDGLTHIYGHGSTANNGLDDIDEAPADPP